MPVGHSGTHLGLGYSRSDYELGAAAQALGAEGVADTYSIYGRMPLFDNGRGFMELKYGYDYRDITDELTAYNSAEDVPHLCRWGGEHPNRRRAYLPPR